QMKRYKVPRLAFLNKMDRMGAGADKGARELREKLGHNAVLMQIPVGAEENFRGVVDLITKKAYFHSGDNGEHISVEDCPADLVDLMEEKRAAMIDAVAEFDEEVMEKYLEGQEPTEEELHRCVRNGTQSLQLTPVFMGSAFKNKGVQPLLN